MLIPAGMVLPMCFCGDPFKREASDEEETYKRRYWMCGNWAFGPPQKVVLKGVLEPPPLCDFEQWIDLEVKEKDRPFILGCKEFDVEIKRRIALRKKMRWPEKRNLQRSAVRPLPHARRRGR
ncbi:hypothetical protein BS78_08G055100 [Paspalum vaginatum]|nr:hypothetical protein BS78_08G055100 [Paspalum vaginatum]